MPETPRFGQMSMSKANEIYWEFLQFIVISVISFPDGENTKNHVKPCYLTNVHLCQKYVKIIPLTSEIDTGLYLEVLKST